MELEDSNLKPTQESTATPAEASNSDQATSPTTPSVSEAQPASAPEAVAATDASESTEAIAAESEFGDAIGQSAEDITMQPAPETAVQVAPSADQVAVAEPDATEIEAGVVADAGSEQAASGETEPPAGGRLAEHFDSETDATAAVLAEVTQLDPVAEVASELPVQAADSDSDKAASDSNKAASDADQAAGDEVDDPKSVELSAEFVGQWSNLISTTNWEKGKIICQWRDKLITSASPAAAYSDEAWSRRVGGVSPQHVGRLRRVFERFGQSFSSYIGVYWSHFLAALDWHDAEMWLQGATESKWSVSQMRGKRWESQGGKPEEKPKDSDVVSVSPDEDFTPLSEAEGETKGADGTRAVAEGPRDEAPDFGDEDSFDGPTETVSENVDAEVSYADATDSDQESPFATLPSLPVDLSEALEQFKLGIIRHRASEWSEISKDDIIKALEALKTFTSM